MSPIFYFRKVIIILTTVELAKRGIDASGYKSAQKYYGDLKAKLIRQSVNRVKREGIHKTYKKINEEIEKEVLNGINNSQEMIEEAEKLLMQVEEIGNKILLDENIKSHVSNIVNKIRNKKVNSNRTKKNNERIYLDRLKRDQKIIFEQINKADFLQKCNLPTSGDTKDIENQISSYLVRYLYQQIVGNNLNINKQNYINSLKGYYQEISDYGILDKYFSNVNMNTFHTGGVGISSKANNKNTIDTELDLIVSKIDNVEKILIRNENLKQDISALSNLEFQELDKEFIKRIEWFGEQTKAWNLKTNKFLYPIGNRANLLSTFLKTSEAQVENGKSYQALQGIQFLAQYKNILLALGPTNVIMGTGGKRMWMADFIQIFREMNYLLAFSGGSKNPLTNHIILTRLYNKNIGIYD